MSVSDNTISEERLEYLTEWATERLIEANSDMAFVRIGTGKVAWIDPNDSEVLIITIEPARIVVAT